MNHQRVSVFCDITPDLALEIDLQTIADYLTFLYRIARTGGHTTEEEIYVESLASAMGIDPAIFEKAVLQSRDATENIRDAAAKLKRTPLRESAYLDACHLSRIDGYVTAEESHALHEAAVGLGLDANLAERTRELAAHQERYLRIFCHLADQPDPADLWQSYLQEGLRQSDRQRRIILPKPEITNASERTNVLAIILRIAGVGWKRSAKESTLENLSHFLALDEAQRANAEALAWQLDSSLGDLSNGIHEKPLQLIVICDLYRVCLSDTEFSTSERTLIENLVTRFQLDPEQSRRFIEMTYDEANLREAVRQLSETHSVDP